MQRNEILSIRNVVLATIVSLIAIGSFAFGLLTGSSEGAPVEEAIEHRYESQPDVRYAIRVNVDDDFYSFYRGFNAQTDSVEAAALVQNAPRLR